MFEVGNFDLLEGLDMPGVSAAPAATTPDGAQPISNLSNPDNAELEQSGIEMRHEEADQLPFAGEVEQDARMHEVADDVTLQADVDQHVDQAAKGMCNWQFVTTHWNILYIQRMCLLWHMHNDS
jgi:hypothetical protein